jgi:hypothetical protein
MLRGSKAEKVKGLITKLLSGRDGALDTLAAFELGSVIISEDDLPEDTKYFAVAPLPFGEPSQQALLLKAWISGTGHYIYAWAIHEQADGVRVFQFYGSEKASGEWHVLQDLDRNGSPEIVMRHFLGDYEGWATLVDVTAVFRWTGTSYVRADQQFPRFYARHVVPDYQRLMRELRRYRNSIDSREREAYDKLVVALAAAKKLASGYVGRGYTAIRFRW